MEQGVLIWLRQQWDRAVATACVVAAVIMFIVGWYGVSDKAYAEEQIPYIVSCGLFGLLLLGVAATLWVSADLRDEWRKLNDIDRRLADAGYGPPSPDSSR